MVDAILLLEDRKSNQHVATSEDGLNEILKANKAQTIAQLLYSNKISQKKIHFTDIGVKMMVMSIRICHLNHL